MGLTTGGNMTLKDRDLIPEKEWKGGKRLTSVHKSIDMSNFTNGNSLYANIAQSNQ